MTSRTILRRLPVLLLIGGALLVGGCTTLGGPISRLFPLAGSSSDTPGSSPFLSAPSPEAASPQAQIPTDPSLPVAVEGSSPSAPQDAQATPAPPIRAAHPTVTGHITAGPTCPVETEPPTPGCAPRPVAGATIVATDAAGREVAKAISAADGLYALDLNPGTYTLTPNGSSLWPRTPPSTTVTVEAGAPSTVTVDFVFDTGIR